MAKRECASILSNALSTKLQHLVVVVGDVSLTPIITHFEADVFFVESRLYPCSSPRILHFLSPNSQVLVLVN